MLKHSIRPAGLLAVLAAGSCSSPPTPPTGVQVTREQFGDSWPFAVGSGYLDCVQPSCAVFRTGSTTYGLNGLAKSRGFQDIRPIWRADPNAPGLKINIGPMIDLALKQCQEAHVISRLTAAPADQKASLSGR